MADQPSVIGRFTVSDAFVSPRCLLRLRHQIHPSLFREFLKARDRSDFSVFHILWTSAHMLAYSAVGCSTTDNNATILQCVLA